MVIGDFKLRAQDDKTYSYKIVSDSKEENDETDTWYVYLKNPLVQAVINAQKQLLKEVKCNGQSFSIVKFYIRSGFISEKSLEERRIVDFTTDDKIIHIYSHNIACRENKKHVLEIVRAKILFYRKLALKDVFMEVEYCSNCRKYFISKKILKRYEEKYGVLLFPRKDCTIIRDNEYYFATDTILSRWGYIAQLEKQNSNTRRAIINFLLETKKASKMELMKILSGFIEYRWHCTKAIQIWKDDYDYIEKYNIEKERRCCGILLD